MSAEAKKLADQALMQIQELELTLFQLETRNPAYTTDLAQVGRYHLDAFRKLIGNPMYWEHQPHTEKGHES